MKTVKLATFIENPDNPQTVTAEDFALLVESLRTMPQTLAASKIAYVTDYTTVDGADLRGQRVVIAGNKRLRALKQLAADHATSADGAIKFDRPLPAEWFYDLTPLGLDARRHWLLESNIGRGEWDAEKLLAQFTRDELADHFDDLDEHLPRFSESHCIAQALRLIRKNAPQVKWVVSFADGCSCGDGTIYRASNFILTGITVNGSLYQLPSGEKVHALSITSQPDTPRPELGGRSISEICGGSVSISKYMEITGAKKIPGYMLRYVYFIDPKWRERLTVDPLPFSRIDEIGAGMYKGERVTQAERHEAGVREKLEKRAANAPRKEGK